MSEIPELDGTPSQTAATQTDDAVSRRERSLAHLVHWTLIAGLLVSSVLILLGLTLVFGTGQQRPIGPPPQLRALLAGAARGDGLDLLELGLVVLMFTPVARVLMLALGWGRNREWRSMGIALAVLALLIVSLSLGAG